MTLKVYVFSFLSAFCAMGALFWIYTWYKAICAKFLWRDTFGTIIRIEIDIEKDSEWGTSYHPKIEYSYIVDEVQYIGDKLMFSDEGGFTEKFIKQYEVGDWIRGSQLVLKYSPANPNESVIFTKFKPGSVVSFLGAILGAALFCIGAFYENSLL